MKQRTRQYLVDLNRRFYHHHGAAFDGTRQRPWQGWERMVEMLTETSPDPTSPDPTSPDPVSADPTSAAATPPWTVLDVGCGNARLASYLHQALPSPLRYVGIDSSPELLASAATRPAAEALHRADLLSDDLEILLDGERFRLVTSFGVLHHVPGVEQRRQTLRRLLDRCRPGGRLVVSIWQLDRQPRFERKVLPWSEHLEHSADAQKQLDLDDLDAGDYLLTWSGDRLHPRYCHFPDDAEIDDWLQYLGQPQATRWRADGVGGTTNLYLAFRG